MKLKKTYFKIFFKAIIFCTAIFSFSQEAQRPFVIVDNVHSYDLNPHTASYSNEAQVFTALYEGLFSYDPITLEPRNALCTEYKISRDKKKYTFTITDNAFFSDGTAITAQTVRTSWLKLLAQPDAPFSSFLDCIEGAVDFKAGKISADDVRIQAKDDSTLTVKLKEPTAQFLTLLCHHSLVAVSESENVYSGPFVVKSYNSNGLILEKNEYYREKEKIRISEIKILQSDDSKENAYLFNAGKADWIMGYADNEILIEKNSIHANETFGTTYIFFKTKNEPWDKIEFRQALLEAIPYDKLRENYFSQAATLVPNLEGYSCPYGIDSYDLENAIEMMDDARKKYNIPKDEKLSIVFATYENELLDFYFNTLKEAWEPLGVVLQKQTVPHQIYNHNIPQWNADLFLYSWLGDYADPYAFLELFKGNNSLNVSGYFNEKYDALLSKAASTIKADERYEILSEAEQVLLDDNVIIPIGYSVAYNIINLNEVGGWIYNALDIHPLKYIFLKETKYTPPENFTLIKH